MAVAKIANRVLETSTTTGTGTLNLSGAATNFRTFVTGVTSGIVFYLIINKSAGEWEAGYGTVTAGSPDTLSRTSVYDNHSGTTSLVSFSSGTKDVMIDIPSSKLIARDYDTSRATVDINGSVYLPETQGTNSTASGIIGAATAGESLVFGDTVYTKSDGKLWKASATDATKLCTAMAIATISANAVGDFIYQGKVRLDAWNWTVGGLIFQATTAGTMTQTKPAATDNAIQSLGICTPNADTILFMPSLVYGTST